MPSNADVSYGLLFSVEYTGEHMTHEAFLTLLYRALFNREPDFRGFINWLDILDGAQFGDIETREYVLKNFIFSQEFENRCNRYTIRP